MKQVKTTIILSAFAVVSLTSAISVYVLAPNAEDGQNELIGEVFYPEFTDPVQASSVKLVVWDGENKTTKEFNVKKATQTRLINGEPKEVELWALPDYDDYPVESPERLRETAGSVMNIERLSLASKDKEEHERLGVVDPNDEKAKLKEPQQIGRRIILLDDSGNTVCDLIIGNSVDAETSNEVSEEDRDLVKGDRYYVRQPDENATYVARLDLQIKTNFEDWIDSDLLQVGDANVKNIQFLNYTVEEKMIEKFGGRVPVRQGFEELIVRKENNAWTIDDLKTETEEVDSSPLSELERQLSGLSILQVEPKPTYQDNEMKILNADLSVNAPPGMGRNDQIRIQQQVLGPQGFIVGLENEKKVTPSLLSTNGELKFATDAGLIYHLFFGYDVKIKGKEFEFAPAKKEEKELADGKSDNSKQDDAATKGKIMSVHVTFDPALIEKPVKPIKPVPPAKPDLSLPTPGVNPPAPQNSEKAENPPKSEPADNLKSSDKKGKNAAKSGEPKSADPKPAEKGTAKNESAPKKEKSDGAECGVDDFEFTSEPFVATQEKDAKQGKEETKPKQEKSTQESKKKAKSVDQDSVPKKQESSPPPKKKKGPTPTQEKQPKKSSDKSATDQPPKKPAKQETQEKGPAKNTEKQGDDGKTPVPPVKTPAQIFAEKMQAYNTAMQQYESSLATYETEMEAYEKAMEEYNQKIEDSKKLVADLNSRFADWFYIVDAAELEKVKLNRSQVVRPKTKTETPPPGGLPPNFNFPGGNPIPGLNNPPQPKKSGAEKNPPKKSETGNEKKSVPGKADQNDAPADKVKSKPDPPKTKSEPGDGKGKAKSDPSKTDQPKTDQPKKEKPVGGTGEKDGGEKRKAETSKTEKK